jgi:23S rRNA (uracil1939-C5)-methyltransferase
VLVECAGLAATGSGVAHPVQEQRAGSAAHSGSGSGSGPGGPAGVPDGAPVILVPNLLPGERALVRIAHVSSQGAHGKSRPAHATVMRRHNASAERQIPACAAFGQCGGCTLQHLCYEAQLDYKRALVREALAPLWAGGLREEPCVPSPSPLWYRSRVKLVPALASAERGSADGAEPSAGTPIILGAYAPRSHRVLDMAGCKVNAPALRALGRDLAARFRAAGLSIYDENSGRGSLRYVLLREVRSGALQVSLVVADPPPRAPLMAVVAALQAAFPALASVVLHHNAGSGNALLAAPPPSPTLADPGGEDSDFGSQDEVLLGRDFLYEDLGEPGSSLALRVRVSARSFLQVNRAIASRIYADIAASLPRHAGQTILDLYCGVGGLGRTVLLAAQQAQADARLIGLEVSPSAVADAEHGAREAGLGASVARFLCGAVEQTLPAVLPTMRKDQAGGFSAGTVALLNPPRRGCTKEVLAALVAGAPRTIAYVSCNVQSLARDLKVLAASGYRVTKITPYDMHPGTPHVETVALLEC